MHRWEVIRAEKRPISGLAWAAGLAFYIRNPLDAEIPKSIMKRGKHCEAPIWYGLNVQQDVEVKIYDGSQADHSSRTVYTLEVLTKNSYAKNNAVLPQDGGPRSLLFPWIYP